MYHQTDDCGMVLDRKINGFTGKINS
jgi:hypothetical protein